MTVEPFNNLVFDRVEYRIATGKTYAFVTCIDKGSTGKGTEEKRYWAEVDERDSASELHHVMGYGAKWDNIP